MLVESVTNMEKTSTYECVLESRIRSRMTVLMEGGASAKGVGGGGGIASRPRPEDRTLSEGEPYPREMRGRRRGTAVVRGGAERCRTARSDAERCGAVWDGTVRDGAPSPHVVAL